MKSLFRLPFAHNIDDASSFNLDLDKLHRQRLVVQGASGAGKSGAIRRLIECAYTRFQVVVIDPEDEYASLRTLFPAVIGSAAPGGDFLLSPKMGCNLASGILRAGIHAVLQVGEMTWDEQREFTGEFIEGLLGAPRDLWRPLLVVVDEAQRFAPQGTEVASSEAMRALATTGRKRGYTGVFAVQRLSQFSKDVLGQCQNRLMGRADQRLDQKAAADVLGFSMSSANAKELTSLETRCFWGHGPAISRTPVMLEICETTTECESEAGADTPPPPAELADAIKALATIKEPDHSGGANKMVDPDEIQMARDEGYAEGYDEGYAAGHAAGVLLTLDKSVDAIRALAPELEAGNPGERQVIDPFADEPAATPATASTPPQVTSEDLKPADRLILDTLNWLSVSGFKSPKRVMLAGLAGVSAGGGAFINRLGKLRSMGMIDYPEPNCVCLTPTGRQHAATPHGPATPRDMQRRWRDRLKPQEQAIFDAVISAYPGGVARDDLAHQVGASAGGGAFINRLGRMRNTLGVIEYPAPGTVRAADFLFLK